MASDNILECTTALTQFLLEHSDDDTENLHIYHVINMTEFCDSADYKSFSPVHVTETPHGYHFKTCVKKCGSDNFIISVESCSGKLDNELTWPMEVEFTVHAINESTDKSLSLGNTRLVLNKLKPGVCDCVTSLDIEVNISHLKDFVIDNNLILKCTIKLTSSQKSICVSQSEITSTDRSSIAPYDKTNFRDVLATFLSHNKLVWESLKSNQFTDEITQIAQNIADCTQDDTKIDSIESRIDNVDKRIGDVKEKFMEQQEMMVEWMNNVRKEKHSAKEIRERLKDQHIPKSKVQDTTDGQTFSLQPETQSFVCEVLQTPMRRNFLLIGSTRSGKSATGNSILFKKAFKTAPKKSGTDKVAAQHATVTVSGAPIEITVVISRGDFVDAKAFDLCTEGFDAVLNVVRYDQFFDDDKVSLPYFYRFGQQRLDVRFPHEALISCGVLIVAGGDMYDFDNPDKQEEEHVSIESTPFTDLKSLCQDRFILFDNLTKSEQKQHCQMEKLLATINSFKSSKYKLTREKYVEPMIEDLKKKFNDLYLSQDLSTVFRIAEACSFLNNYGDSKQLKDFQRILMSLKIIKSFKQKRRRQKVVVVGEPCDAFQSSLARMGIVSLPEQFLGGIYDRRLPLLVVIPSNCLSKFQKLYLELIEIFHSRAHRETMTILIVTDDGQLNLSDDKTKFIEWCEEKTGLFKNIYQACSGRVLLFDYQTDDLVLRIEQEADFIVILERIYTEVGFDTYYIADCDRWSELYDQINPFVFKAPDDLKMSFGEANVEPLKNPPKELEQWSQTEIIRGSQEVESDIDWASSRIPHKKDYKF